MVKAALYAIVFFFVFYIIGVLLIINILEIGSWLIPRME